MKQPCVYILASNRDGILYIGVTSDLAHRMVEHNQALLPGFTHRYSIKRLVYDESRVARSVQSGEWRDRVRTG